MSPPAMPDRSDTPAPGELRAELARCARELEEASVLFEITQPSRSADYRQNARRAAAVLARLSATGPTAAPPPDPRLPGLRFARDIVDHWHQRFLRMRDESRGRESAVCGDRAVGVLEALTAIDAEIARLSAPSQARIKHPLTGDTHVLDSETRRTVGVERGSASCRQRDEATAALAGVRDAALEEAARIAESVLGLNDVRCRIAAAIRAARTMGATRHDD